MSIITNRHAAGSMSDLEIRARRGDPLAQSELERQALAAAGATNKLRKAGMTPEEAERELRQAEIHSSTPR